MNIIIIMIIIIIFSVGGTFTIIELFPNELDSHKENKIGLDESPGSPAIKERIELFEKAIVEAKREVKELESAAARGAEVGEALKGRYSSVEALELALADLKRYNNGYKPYKDWSPEEYAC